MTALSETVRRRIRAIGIAEVTLTVMKQVRKTIVDSPEYQYLARKEREERAKAAAPETIQNALSASYEGILTAAEIKELVEETTARVFSTLSDEEEDEVDAEELGEG